MKQPLTVDFETEAIVGNPTIRPPKPVGVSLKDGDKTPHYYGWGHPSGNTCTSDVEPRRRVAAAIAAGRPLLFHNSKFDIAVMREHWAMCPDDPLLVEDTMYQIFLHDPYARSLSLKPSAERILGLPPSEQDELKRWILQHVPEATESTFGAFICRAPGNVVAPYANGDVDRTKALWNRLREQVPLTAYAREQKLMPILSEAERRGIRCDVERLGEDLEYYETVLIWCDREVRRQLRAPNLSLDSPEELANALETAGMVGQWVLTPTGRRSTARQALESAINNPKLLTLLKYRGALAHCLSNFARPWYEMSKATGILHPEWNQVRQARTETDPKGTRTGRLSSSNPNFQNPPNAYELAKPQDDLPELPLMRSYLLPHKGRVWLKRDYSQQELRILAHFSEGRLYERYQANPRIDAHEETSRLIQEYTHLTLPRKYVKIIGFSIIYGSGTTGLSHQLGVNVAEARNMKDAYYLALPEVPRLMKECMNRGRAHQAITTWGGRSYYTEPPTVKNGRSYSYEYKLLNYLIQGSAGDCTKESIVRWDSDKGDGELLATVHDENDIDAPKDDWKPAMAKLRAAMESIEFDVQMLSDGFVGPSWAKLGACE